MEKETSRTAVLELDSNVGRAGPRKPQLIDRGKNKKQPTTTKKKKIG